MKVIIIGAGRVGTAMGYLLKKSGVTILGVYNRHVDSTRKAIAKIGEGKAFSRDELLENLEQANLIMITTPDSQIKKAAEMIADARFKTGNYLMHMSGLLASDILRVGTKAAGVFSFHPLQAVANFAEGVRLLPQSVFTIEGDRRGEKFAAKLAGRLGVRYHFIDKRHKPLYHAAAVVASNYLVTLIDTSYRFLRKVGLDKPELREGILQLVKGTLSNIEKIGPEQALTGPVVRGDFATIETHQRAIREFLPDYYELYQLLGRYTSDLAGNKEMKFKFEHSGGNDDE